MKNPIVAYLASRGPALSSEVAAHLVATLNISRATARQRVSRAGEDVKRLGWIVFPHRSRFLYLEKQFGSRAYWHKLSTALIESGSAYGYALAALRQRGGIVPATQFQIVAGSPMKLSKHLSPTTIFTRLKEAGLVDHVMISGVGECIALVQGDRDYAYVAHGLQAQRLTENILVTAVKDWLKKMGFASYGKVATRLDDALPQVGTFAWDLSGPSYLGPMIRRGPEGTVKPGFVVCDVHLGPEIDRNGAEPFVRKCLTLRSLRNVGPCLQILVADRFTNEAFQFLKQNGVLATTPSNLFGNEIASALRELLSVLQLAAAEVIEPDRFEALFETLSKIEGAANQLRGTLFEFMVADIARKRISQHIFMNRMFTAPDGSGKAEGDVVALTPNKSVTVIECKGWSPRGHFPDDQFKHWLQVSVPRMYKDIRAHPDWKNLEVIFEFWCTASLSAESIAFFEQAKAALNPNRYSIELRLGPQIHDMCEELRDFSLIVAFEKHFMKVGRPESIWHGGKALTFPAATY